MKGSRNWKFIAAGCVAIGCGSSDATAPTGSLGFCTAPLWFAAKNEGSDWRILSNNGAPASFAATPKLSIAFAYNTSSTQVYSLTIDELRELGGTPAFGCGKNYDPSRKLAGSVARVPVGRIYGVFSQSFFATRNGSSFDLIAPNGPTDLLAVTYDSAAHFAIEHAILRRDVDLPTGSVIPVFDFASTEATLLDSASLSVSNVVAGAVTFRTGFSTRGIEVTLRYGTDTLPTVVHALPAALLRPEDFQTLTVLGGCPNFCERKLVYFYHVARPTAVAVGPVPATSVTSAISSTPCSRIRVEMPSQTEYPSLATAWLAWGGSRPTRSISLTTTKGYLGATPSTWALEVPDLNRPDGSCLVDANVAVTTSVTVVDGRLAVYAGTPGRDREIIRTAYR